MTASAPIPIFRSFDEAKAREFYVGFLGFEVTFEHRFDDNSPLYLGLRLGACELHLSEHFGDGTPGAVIRVEVANLDDYCAALNAKAYRHARPGILEQTWGMREMPISDPAGNKIIFCTPM